MVIFDSSKLRVVYVKLKECTQALGGSIRVVDEDHFELTSIEKFIRIPTPMYIVRRFQKEYEVSKFFTPIEAVIVYYEDIVVALERPANVLQERLVDSVDGEKREWQSNCVNNIKNVLMPHIEQTGNQYVWFVDGKYVFRLTKPDPVEVIQSAPYFSEDGRFRNVEVEAFPLADLNNNAIKTEPRSSIAYVAANGQYAMTAPIWKDTSGIASTRLDAEHKFKFDAIDSNLLVNLNFALAAATEIGKLYGPEAIEPLMLDEVMVRLRTVNLPNIANPIKKTYPIDMSFKHTVAWLIGLSQRCDDLHTHMAIRSLLKYLTTKGIFRNSTFTNKHVYRKTKSELDIQATTIAEATEHVDQYGDDISEILRNLRRSRRELDDIGLADVAGLLAEDDD